MSKIGRNQPCPCGSGFKYKKCCLGQQPRQSAQPVSQLPPASAATAPPALPPGTDASMTPYTVARIFEQSPTFAEMQKKRPREANRYWTPTKVAALDVPTIVTRLRQLRIDASAQAFRDLAAHTTSAWQLGLRWIEGLRRGLDRFTTDFVCLAACELWKHYCPERPSIEMLDDWMQQGYELMMKHNEAAAADRWLQLWQVIAERLAPDMTTTDAAVNVFDGRQCLFNWLQDLVQTLLNASIAHPAYAEHGIRFCRQIIAQFPAEAPLFLENFRADLGEFFFLDNDDEQGQQTFRDLIDDFPHRAAGYVRLAEMLCQRAKRARSLDDLRQARHLLQNALNTADDPGDHDVERRLEHLQDDIASFDSDASTPLPP